MKIALLVEGESDERALPALAKRIAGDYPPVRPFRPERARQRGGWDALRKVEPVSERIREIREKDPEFETFVVVLDSHCHPAEDRRQQAGNLERKLREHFGGLDVRCFIVVHELESWFLADRKTLDKLLVRRSSVVACPDPIEGCCAPKDDVLAKAWDYRETRDARRIADEMDLDQAARLCPSFVEFRDLILTLRRKR